MTTTLIIGLLIPLLGTMLGSAFVFFMKDEMSARLQKTLLGFASGVMVAASVWSLLIPSMEMMEQREQSQACLDSAESRQSSAFRQMRRKRQQLSNEESIAILEKATAGTLALLGDDDYPYAVPISYVYHEGKLYFHSALAGHKVDAIRKCDKASFCVIDQDDVQPKKYTTFFRSVIVFGRIRIIEDEQERLETARMLGNRYNPNDDESLQKEIESGFSRMLMIRFDIEHLTGKEAIELVRQRNIGDNVTIGAGSVVTKDIPSNSIAVGNPCKVIRTL